MREATTRTQFWLKVMHQSAKKASICSGIKWTSLIYGIAGLLIGSLAFLWKHHSYAAFSDFWISWIFFSLISGCLAWMTAFIVISIFATPFDMFSAVESQLIDSEKEAMELKTEADSKSATEIEKKKEQSVIQSMIKEGGDTLKAFRNSHHDGAMSNEDCNEQTRIWRDGIEKFICEKYPAFYGDFEAACRNEQKMEFAGGRSRHAGQIPKINKVLSAILRSLG